MNLKFVKLLVMLSVVGPGMAIVSAQEWPTQPIKIVFPYSAGGSGDAVARNLAKRLETATKQTVTVENVTGGGTVVAAQAVINAPADGTRLLFTGASTMTVLKHINTKLPIDPEKELTPITFVNTLPHWLIVRSDRSEKTFEQFVETIRKNPGKISISVNAVGGVAHLSLASWAKRNNLDFLIVPYRGSPPAMIDLIGGTTSAHVDVIGSSLPFVKDRKVKALSLLQLTAIQDLPDVPISPSESNGGLILAGSHHVLAVKTGTPPATVNRIYELIKQVTAESDFVDFLKNLGFERSIPTPEQSMKILTDDSERYKKIVSTTGLKLN